MSCDIVHGPWKYGALHPQAPWIRVPGAVCPDSARPRGTRAPGVSEQGRRPGYTHPMSAISSDEVARVAALARVALSDEEVARLAGELDAVASAFAVFP